MLLAIWLAWVSRGFLSVRIAKSLSCDERREHTQVLLLENFDPDYLVFERGTALYRAGVAPRIVVPVQSGRKAEEPSAVSRGIANVMTEIAHMPNPELVPIDETEPVTLNAARQLREFLLRNQLTSVTVVAPGFRSRRSQMVYSWVFEPAGITVNCVPVFGPKTPQNWTDSWHGIQEVVLQFWKLQYYRFWVLA